MLQERIAQLFCGLQGSKMSSNWTDKDVFKLIQVWSEEGIQKQLEGARQNKHVYEKLSRKLVTYGIEKSGKQCRNKVKKLRQEYKKIKDKHNQTGEERSQWKFYDKLDEILGTRPATRPPVVLETLDHDQTKDSSDETDIGEDLKDNISNQSGLADDSISDTASLVSEQNSSDDRNQTKTVKPKKCKRSKGEIMEDVMVKVMKIVTDSIKSSDKMFSELEEKRLKFEEQQKREERDFQLKMFQMLQQSGNHFYPSYGTSPPPGGLYYPRDANM